jgi:hypothetical protein
MADQLTMTASFEQRLSNQLALGAVVGPIVFTVAWVALGVLQPISRNTYGIMGGIAGAITNPISGLGVGPHADLFNAAFIGCGAITLVGVLGAFLTFPGSAKRRLLCAGLLSLSPIGLAMAGVYTIAASIPAHSFAAALAFLAPVGGFVVAGWLFRETRELRTFGGVLLFAGPLTFFLLLVFAVTFDPLRVAAGEGIAGLTERILMLEIDACYVALGWLAFRRAA